MAADYDVNLRVAELSGNGRTLTGLAVPFGQFTPISDKNGRYMERIMAGAFSAALASRKPRMMYEHGADLRVGKVPIGSFDRVEELSDGLHVSGQLFDNELVRPLIDAARAGELSEWSVHFRTRSDGADESWTRSGGQDQRTVHRATLPEISLVMAGAYPTSATMRNSAAERGRRLRAMGILDGPQRESFQRRRRVWALRAAGVL